MTTYPSLPLIFVAAGLVLLLAVSYLARLVRLHRRILGSLLKLAKADYVPLELPAAAWPSLAEGGIQKLDYAGIWFGQPVQGHFGTAQHGRHARPFSFKVAADGDIQLDFKLYARTDHGEARVFAENLVGVFQLLLETAVHIKMETLSVALAEQARLTLYVQHDLRNLAQWVEWLAADIADARDDSAALGIALHLRTSAPHAVARAHRILDTVCKPPTTPTPPPQSVALIEVIRQAAEHAGISVTLDQNSVAQNTRVSMRRDLLDRTLDNLFSNAAPLLRSRPDTTISISITHAADKVLVTIKMPRFKELAQLPPERLFEPFANGQPGGLGLGLYQARKSLHGTGGELVAEVCQDGLCFLLNLPGAEPNARQV